MDPSLAFGAQSGRYVTAHDEKTNSPSFSEKLIVAMQPCRVAYENRRRILAAGDDTRRESRYFVRLKLSHYK